MGGAAMIAPRSPCLLQWSWWLLLLLLLLLLPLLLEL